MDKVKEIHKECKDNGIEPSLYLEVERNMLLEGILEYNMFLEGILEYNEWINDTLSNYKIDTWD